MQRPLERLERTCAAPIDEEVWKRWKNRVAAGILGLMAVLAVQTSVVHAPGYLINALYHGRQFANIQLHAMAPAERAKLLERLCAVQHYLEKGGINPYDIPDYQSCIGGKPSP
ncbi:hypothetical protein CU669_00235 [Paramagnetospirillum kuznetsovii]|uniref:Uncharacterized protein n=2 Tax=Paramagnetospirillum kuznetsovii TaxID=2053833 RepID=A0A364P2N3_9PROT|nr:hypothetical protein CU669_00235 [Paramagnetospirillum kuznetsovii]